MSRLVALLVVSLLPGAPLATASCLVACSIESAAGAAGTCHGGHDVLWNSSPSVVAGESVCAWVASAPPYVREDRRQPELPMTGAGATVRPAPVDMNDNAGVRSDPSQPPRVRTSPIVLRL